MLRCVKLAYPNCTPWSCDHQAQIKPNGYEIKIDHYGEMLGKFGEKPPLWAMTSAGAIRRHT